MFRIPHKKTVDLNCRHCQTTHLNVPVKFDEDGPYAELGTEPCGHFGCPVRLCSACPQFECSICQLTFCAEHKIEFADLTLCPACMKEIADQGAREAAELQLADQETAAALRQAAMKEVA